MEFSGPFGEEKDRQVALCYWLSPCQQANPSPFPTRCLIYMISQLTLMVCTVFSALDLKNAFWQLPVRLSDIKFTGFYIRRGNFKFLKMPLNGVTFASSSFQHFINIVLRNLPSCCFLCIYDIFFFSKTPQEYKPHVLTDSTHMASHSIWKNRLLVWTTSIFWDTVWAPKESPYCKTKSVPFWTSQNPAESRLLGDFWDWWTFSRSLFLTRQNLFSLWMLFWKDQRKMTLLLRGLHRQKKPFKIPRRLLLMPLTWHTRTKMLISNSYVMPLISQLDQFFSQ